MSDIDRLYLKALKAVTKERRVSGGGRFKGEERAVAKQRAKWAAQSPVYQAIEAKRKLPMPTPEEIKKRSKSYALKYITREYRQGWRTKKVAPEHRVGIMEQAERLATGGSFIPRKTQEAMESAQLQRKNVAVARIGRDWLTVHNIAGTKDEGYNKPYFIGPGLGYDVRRIVVFAHDDSEAYEIAQEKYPKDMFSEVISRAKLDKIEKEDSSEAERYTYIERLNKWGLPEEDIRIFKVASEFYRNAKALGGHTSLYRLPDGRVIEAR